MSSVSCHSSSSNSEAVSCVSDSSVLTAGAIVGIVIAALVGVAIIICLVVLILRLQRRRSRPWNGQGTLNYSIPPTNPYRYPPQPPPGMYDPPSYSKAITHEDVRLQA